MAHGPNYKVVFRRRREGKTDYRKRLRLLSSGLPRLVVRRSNKYIYAQIISSNEAKDDVIAQACSRELIKLGYPTGLTSAPASYLTGMLIALRALKKGVKEAIIDIGLLPHVPKSNVYALLKGCLDMGLEIPHSDEVIPSEERIQGAHIAAYAKKLKQESPEKYSRLFSKYISSNVEPERLEQLFEEIKNKIKSMGEKNV
ncbi:50S ribosomal protein L18 [Candidatus Marsarchaeota G2 archaeon ECH_B_SAG-F08]|jgi:large subunit ribosomal protein L18|uniref:Large ribosomal subunit protein uL18 n=4 Tax=Candidatus Marsarchaeota TaxID=1978152 RepID=A0A2R6C433_9ARCH|nr:MAG: 50S ribosomal protein L18 [Candidatus Marsarchaeota G1 archaeon BE_D]PSN88872.1 MAG: 50S ribosomal protein L18 [Candidatus Marsarchaeota G1 archaeon OSP_C]PSN97503.1 MAG: 50S ribosomal protein L18 [Candidatus Marsarchaeota G2 archaeon ECH_B_SAG-F08]PSO05627.1 MAG: 50S ribosomal protein L18 [Candidatus Marsarchaeota G2 archaeon ECH_B_SAG-G06]